MTPRSVRPLLAAGLVALALSLHAQTPASPAPKPVLSPLSVSVGKSGEEMIDSFKLADGDIDSVLSTLETLTGRTVIRPGALQTASYTLKITRPIPKSELITALETLLALNQIAVTPMGDRFLKVVALAQARSESPELITGPVSEVPTSGKVATKVFQLEFLRVTEFVPQIQTMLTPGIGGGVVSLEKSNVVMITDTVANLQRIEALLTQVDHPRENSLTPRFYQLHFAKASDLVTKIHSMLAGAAQNQLRATTTYNADDRTNQVIVIADPHEYALFDALIEKLDTKSDPNTRNEVIYLKHADAKDVSTLLTSLITGQTTATQKASQSVHQGQVATPGQPAAPAPATPAPVAAAVASALPEGPGASNEFSSLVTIQPDERTNSVVVSGTVDDIRLIHDIIDKIDVLLAQVSIQVVIAEVTLSDTDTNGLNALSATFGKASNGGTSITNFSGSFGGWSVASGVTNPLSFVAALQSAGDKHSVKILQTNTIVTTHSKQGEIVVSEQQPVITGTTSTPTASTTSTGFSTNSTVSYKDIGITLKVTPLIGDDGSIQLTIDQVVDNNQGSVTIDGNAQPIIGHREATATVNVMDGQMVILGGLQSTSHALDRSKIGFFYEIPVVSNLLGARNNDLERSELLLFIRPHVIPPAENTSDTTKQINGISNGDQIRDYLKDPTKVPPDKESLLEHLKQ